MAGLWSPQADGDPGGACSSLSERGAGKDGGGDVGWQGLGPPEGVEMEAGGGVPPQDRRQAGGVACRDPAAVTTSSVRRSQPQERGGSQPVRHPPSSRGSGKARGPARALGRSRGCHLSEVLAAAPSFLGRPFLFLSSSLLPPEVPSPFPQVITE